MNNRLINYLKSNPEKVFTATQVKSALGISDEDLKRQTIEVIGTHGLKVVGQGEAKKFGFVDVLKYGVIRETEGNATKLGHYVLTGNLPEMR